VERGATEYLYGGGEVSDLGSENMPGNTYMTCRNSACDGGFKHRPLT